MNGIAHVGDPILEDPRLYEYHALVCIKQPGKYDGSLGQMQITNFSKALVKLDSKSIWFPTSELLLVEFDAELVERRRRLYRQLGQELQAREKKTNAVRRKWRYNV